MKEMFGQLVIATNLKEMAVEELAQQLNGFSIVEEHISTVDEILDTVPMHGLANYGVEHGLFTTLIFKSEYTDEEAREKIETMFWGI